MNLLYNYIEYNEPENNDGKGYLFLNEENSIFLSIKDDYNFNNSRVIVCINDDVLVNINTIWDPIDYVQLGLEGYKYIKSKVSDHVFVIRMGIGNVTRKENEVITSIVHSMIYPNVKFIDIPTTRKLPNQEVEVFPSTI